MTTYSAYYNTIYVIESLSSQELKTGTNLYNRIMRLLRDLFENVLTVSYSW